MTGCDAFLTFAVSIPGCVADISVWQLLVVFFICFVFGLKRLTMLTDIAAVFPTVVPVSFPLPVLHWGFY